MDQVKVDVRQHIDSVLDYLLEAWKALPQIERDIDKLDLIEQIDYVEEWTPKLDLLSRVQRHAAMHSLSEQQMARYAELLALVNKYQPVLDRLRKS